VICQTRKFTLPAGHFAPETHLDAISGYIRGFLGRVLD
jgi:hypothetical protein